MPGLRFGPGQLLVLLTSRHALGSFSHSHWTCVLQGAAHVIPSKHIRTGSCLTHAATTTGDESEIQRAKEADSARKQNPKVQQEDTIFAKILRKEIAANIFYEDEMVLCTFFSPICSFLHRFIIHRHVFAAFLQLSVWRFTMCRQWLPPISWSSQDNPSQCSQLHLTVILRYTVEPPNKGHFGANSFVPCREVVSISEVK